MDSIFESAFRGTLYFRRKTQGFRNKVTFIYFIFIINNGLRQGDVLSSILFKIAVNKAVRAANIKIDVRIYIHMTHDRPHY